MMGFFLKVNANLINPLDIDLDCIVAVHQPSRTVFMSANILPDTNALVVSEQDMISIRANLKLPPHPQTDPPKRNS